MFLFKKIAGNVFDPLSLILMMSVAGLILLFGTSRKKSGKLLIVSSIVLLALCAYTATADLFIHPLEIKYPPFNSDNSLRSDELPKLVVVLAGGHKSGSGIPIISKITYSSLVRLVEGIRIYRMIPECKLLLSGGSGAGNDSSAGVMAQAARAMGVNEQDIIMETRSRDTRDQAHIIRSILGDERFIMVTSASHMPRSMALFMKLGMNPVPAPAGFLSWEVTSTGPGRFFPSSVNLRKIEIAMHEYLGIVWAKLRNQV